jgi:hypothetical protein
MGVCEGPGRTQKNYSEVTGSLSRGTVVVDIESREALLVVLLVELRNVHCDHGCCVHLCTALRRGSNSPRA